MPSQSKLIKQGIYLTDSVFNEIIKRLSKGIKSSDTLEDFINQTKDYTMNNPLVVNGFKDELLEIILKETNNHKFSRPAQKELTRLTIENRVGDLIVDVGEDIKTSVRDIVKHGYNNGLSQDEIAENITHRVGVIKNTRARTIARTEIARTATASDYVINLERGATHFTVDCRETCCEVCRKDYNFGKKEYSIDEVDMLPPRHPNCRCYTLFFKKEGIENNSSNNFNRFYDKFEKTNQIGVDDNNWNIDNIKKNIANFIDKDDNLDMLAENLFDFIQVAKEHPNESLIASDKNFNVFEIIKGDEPKSIKVPDKYIKEVKGSYFGLTGHSHPQSKIPLPGLDDLNYGCITLNSKYNVIFAPGFGATLIKKSNPTTKIGKGSFDVPYEDAYIKQDEYLTDSIAHEMDNYKDKIKNDYSKSLIQQRKERDAIRRNVRFTSLKQRVEFFNIEFNQFELEFLYIVP